MATQNNQLIIQDIKNVNHAILKLNEGLSAIERISPTIADAAIVCTQLNAEVTLACKQIEQQMHLVDRQFDLLIKQMDINLSAFKAKAESVNIALNGLNKNMSKTLDYILTMDDGDIESKIELKMRLLETINKHVDTVANILMRVL